ncbi:hypothetical protein EVC27_009 [Rhizobium phage RHph_I1_6]|uniref:Uncharacterized protein n=1 Tax=Rhizobium phage RHph_I1_6 TaxID=2509728 RepID=A0A7S5RMW1_9CAUD|nr:hypothetical protein PP745_gp009 [Rhizobium phage RHph_I1_6]QIG76534.1 hypothetical protein EVC27_009 [Rhizobium phage RHph_I1_6]
MRKSNNPRYVSPIFYRAETPFDCTINVIREYDLPNVYVKSRFSSDAMARLEPHKSWGKLLYRIKVKIKEIPDGNQR